MKSNAEFLNAVLAKYEKRRIERRRRTVLLSSTASALVLVLVAVLGMGRFLPNREGTGIQQPVIPPQSDVQPQSPRIVTASRDGYTAGQMDAGEIEPDGLYLDPALERAMDDPANEGALFRVVVSTNHDISCFEKYVGVEHEHHWRETVQSKVDQMNAVGISCEIARDMTYGFYVTGTKEQIESINEQPLCMEYYAWLALPARLDGYSEVYTDTAVGWMQVARETDVFEVCIVSAWDEATEKHWLTGELFNAHRIDAKKGEELWRSGQMENALLAIGERYEAKDYRLSADSDRMYASIYGTVTREQLLAMSDDPEIRCVWVKGLRDMVDLIEFEGGMTYEEIEQEALRRMDPEKRELVLQVLYECDDPAAYADLEEELNVAIEQYLFHKREVVKEQKARGEALREQYRKEHGLPPKEESVQYFYSIDA